GYKCVEAEPKLDKFLEDSLLNNFADVRIIHGMGAGALRNFVHNYLKNNPLAKGFAYEENDRQGKNYGVTVVKMR
ncbi:MAG TPA: Smr/MutS family protein, partial [Spirochaetota bacterium]|nr:Smr/MutS family protein [Spirochaetota bacterium]